MMFGRHPEEICQKCARPNITWYTSNALWNRVIEDKPAILCPVCFVKAAEEKGVKPTGWFLTEEADARDELSGEMVGIIQSYPVDAPVDDFFDALVEWRVKREAILVKIEEAE